MTKYRLLAPQVVTGGPELLHQLGAELNALGHDAAMCYYPFRDGYTAPEPYRKYNVPVAPFEDKRGITYIIPEVITGLPYYLRRAKSMIWWLSVPNYLAQPLMEPKLFRRMPPMEDGMLRRLSPEKLHRYCVLQLSQSQLATDFLASHKVPSEYLSDYLNDDFFDGLVEGTDGKSNTIAYNPTKGIEVTEKLQAAWPEFDWLPLADMSRQEMIGKLRSVKLYIDFGHHPGKDRIPREAAVSGACVITGVRGAAANPVDVPIPRKYKLDQQAPGFVEAFGGLVRDIFVNFKARSAEFDAYRARTYGERAAFRADVERIFPKPG